jgi:hypothetical protein
LQPLAKKITTFALMLFTDCFIFLFYIYAFIYKKTYRIHTALGLIQQIFLFYTEAYEMNFFNMMGAIRIAH